MGAAAPLSEEPSQEDIMHAIDVLKRAGLNISVYPVSAHEPASSGGTEYSNKPSGRANGNPAEYVNSDYEMMRMMMGNGNSNNDPMMNMLPYMLNANSDGKNIDPQVIQTLMMNSMMNGISGLNSTDNK